MSPWAVLSVVALLALFGALSWWIRRAAGPRLGGEALVVQAHRRLDAQHGLWIVQVEGRRLLLGSGADGVRLLSELSPPPSP